MAGQAQDLAVTEEFNEEERNMMKEAEEKKDGNHAGNPRPPIPPTGFFNLFRFADWLDYILMAIGTVGAIVHGSMLPLLARVMAELLNSFASNENNVDKMTHVVVKFAKYYIVAGAVVWVSSWAEISCWMWTAERQSAKLRIKYLEAALNQDIHFFDAEILPSDFVVGISTAATIVQDAIGEKLGNFIHYLAVFVSGVLVGFTAVWQLTLVTLAVFPIFFLIMVIHGKILNDYSAKCQELVSHAGNIVEQTIVQIRTVMAYVGESRASQAYSAALKISRRIGYRVGFLYSLGLGAGSFAKFSFYALVFWYGGYSIRHHFGNGGQMAATITSVVLGAQALLHSVSIWGTLVRAKFAAAVIFQIIDHKPDIDRNNDSGLELDSVTGQVELNNIDFCYPSRPDNRVLKNFSLTIPAGKTIALVGSSGSGKSTVVSLIERFYDPTSGQVLLDGHDIKTLKLRWLRQQVGLVSQEPALLATTIKENILLGSPDASMAEIEEASKVANAHSFITKLPHGYDTQVGERGLQLSGGQKQRIAIARAMLKNPSILLLDEATSALDSESEKLVQEALDRFMIGRTTLVIAHRLSTIQKADLVAVLEQGSLFEIGRHDELIAMGDKSIYAKLIKMQEATHETALKNAGKISARSSARNSFSSPIIAPNSYGRSPIITTDSFYVHSPFIAPNSSYGRSPYSGRLSEFSTPDQPEKIAFQKQASAFWRLAKMNSAKWPYALIGCIGSIICGSFDALFAYVFSDVLSVYFKPNQADMTRQVAKYCYLFVGLSFAALLFTILQHFFWDISGQNMTILLKEKLLAVVLKNEMAWFDQEENESSKVTTRLIFHPDNVKKAIGDRISVVMQNTTLLLFSWAVSFVLQWRLTFVIIAIYPIAIVAHYLQKIFTQGFSGDLEAAHADGSQLAGEAIANLRTIAAFDSESNIVSLFTSKLETPLSRCFWKGQIAGALYGISQFSLYASNALGIWYASWLVKHEMSDFSKTIRVYLILMMSSTAASETLCLAPDFIKGARSIRLVFELLDRKTQMEPDDQNTTIISSRLRGEIVFRHVEFSYPSRPNVPIFRDLNFYAGAGKILALVGPSGCGKSSIIALIERFYDPSSGRIMIDGKDIRNYNLKSLRRHIALVPQEPCLFATSIYENIAYGNDSATEAEIIEAATLANAHKFISSLPDGYRTFAGERGVQLSGGQKQRIAMARAFLKKPDIMLLDEATSALDSESERCVQEALKRVCAGKTTIIVAHRLATIRNAHVIAVINDGKVAEQGSDSRLLRNHDGIYARMLQLQMSTHGQAVDMAFGSSSTRPEEHQDGTTSKESQ